MVKSTLNSLIQSRTSKLDSLAYYFVRRQSIKMENLQLKHETELSNISR